MFLRSRAEDFERRDNTTLDTDRSIAHWGANDKNDHRKHQNDKMGPEGVRPGEITTSYARFLSILAGYDKRGVNPLGSTISVLH